MEQRLQELSIGKAVLFGLVIAAFYYFTIYDDGASRELNIQNLQKQVATQQKELNKIQTTIAESKKIEELVKDLEDNMEIALEAAPEDFNDLELMQILSSEAKVVGANIVSLTTAGNKRRRPVRRGRGAVQDKGPLFEPVNVVVKLEGTYNQLMLFLSNLTKTKRLIVPDSLKLNIKNRSTISDTASPTLNFEGNFIGYKYNPEGTADAE